MPYLVHSRRGVVVLLIVNNNGGLSVCKTNEETGVEWCTYQKKSVGAVFAPMRENNGFDRKNKAGATMYS